MPNTMRKSRCLGVLSLLAFLFVSPLSAPAAETGEGAGKEITAKTRCPVCGMFVAKYANWIAAVRHADGTVQYCDGMKDALAYFFKPGAFGAKKGNAITAFEAKDYYTLAWIDARQAFFVVGSDVLGPMGHEFIPFATREAAESFRKDHKGSEVLAFSEITEKRVEAMRSGEKMR